MKNAMSASENGCASHSISLFSFSSVYATALSKIEVDCWLMLIHSCELFSISSLSTSKSLFSLQQGTRS